MMRFLLFFRRQCHIITERHFQIFVIAYGNGRVYPLKGLVYRRLKGTLRVFVSHIIRSRAKLRDLLAVLYTVLCHFSLAILPYLCSHPLPSEYAEQSLCRKAHRLSVCLRNHLRTEKGRTVEICEPEIITQEEKQRIEDLVNQQEQDILSGNIGSAGSIVDMDSWIRRYLIDEIAGNTDADLSSSYFYCTDGKLYAGPVWDYDTAFGNTIQNANPQAFTAKNRVKYGDLIAPYYSVLFANPVFYDRMAEIYQQEFLPVLNALIAHDIQNLADTIHSAATANSIRWPVIPASQSDFSTWVAYSTSGETIRQYLRQKVDFLNDALINRVDYATLQFQLPDGGAYWSASVPVGAVLEKTDVINEPFYSEIAKGIWIHADTAEVVDLSRPITTDMRLVRPVENTEPSVSLISDDSIIILSVAMLLVMFVTFITIDVVQRCKERRGTNERK